MRAANSKPYKHIKEIKTPYSDSELEDDEREVRERDSTDSYIFQPCSLKEWASEYINRKVLNGNPVIDSNNKEEIKTRIEVNIEDICSKLVQLSEREFGLFFRHCFSLVHEFENILEKFIKKNNMLRVNPPCQ